VSQGARNNAEAMYNHDEDLLEHHDADDDAGADPDDAADSTAVAGDRLVAFGQQGPGRHGNANATEPRVLERQRLHGSRRTCHESDREGERGGVEIGDGWRFRGETVSLHGLEAQEDPPVGDESPNK